MDTWNFHPQIVGEPTLQDSNTVPDDSLTVRQILDRHLRGLPYRVIPVEWPDSDETEDMPLRPDERYDYDLSDAEADLSEINARMSASSRSSDKSADEASQDSVDVKREPQTANLSNGDDVR